MNAQESSPHVPRTMKTNFDEDISSAAAYTITMGALFDHEIRPVLSKQVPACSPTHLLQHRRQIPGPGWIQIRYGAFQHSGENKKFGVIDPSQTGLDLRQATARKIPARYLEFRSKRFLRQPSSHSQPPDDRADKILLVDVLLHPRSLTLPATLSGIAPVSEQFECRHSE